MTKYFFILLTCLLLPWHSFARVNIFACEPEWKSLADTIGGDHVTTSSATTAFEDAHHVKAKPSLLSTVGRADLIICTGGELEVGWLPLLLDKAKASVQPGNPGYLMASDYVTRLDIPTRLDRSQGDIHPGGNPHIHLNPHNIEAVAIELSRRLETIDPASASFYQQQLKDFLTRWHTQVRIWETKAKPLTQMPIVIGHNHWAYLTAWLGLKEVAMLEPKPGLPPTASHLETVLQSVGKTPAKAILRAPFEDKAPSQWLSQRSHIPVVTLAYTVGGSKDVTNLEQLFDRTISQLLEQHDQ